MYIVGLEWKSMSLHKGKCDDSRHIFFFARTAQRPSPGRGKLSWQCKARAGMFPGGKVGAYFNFGLATREPALVYVNQATFCLDRFISPVEN